MELGGLVHGCSRLQMDEPMGTKLHFPLTSSFLYIHWFSGWQFILLSTCLLVLAEIISSTLKMEAICSSETSVATQQTTLRHILEDDTLHKLEILSASQS
jgi:hypothetical protein